MAVKRKTFFVSYTGADEGWANWIAWTLRERGYSVTLEKWDIPPGETSISSLNERIEKAQTVLIVLSSNYLELAYAHSAWTAAFMPDPKDEGEKILVVRVEECEPTGPLVQFGYLDLVGLAKSTARKAILNRKGLKPSAGPSYPGDGARPNILVDNDFNVVEEAINSLPTLMRLLMRLFVRYRQGYHDLVSAELKAEEKREAHEYIAHKWVLVNTDRELYKIRAAAAASLMEYISKLSMSQLQNIAELAEKTTTVAGRIEGARLDGDKKRELDSSLKKAFNRFDKLLDDFVQRDSETNVNRHKRDWSQDGQSGQKDTIRLGDKSREELLAMAGRLKISRRSRMTKDQLKNAILRHDWLAIRKAASLRWWKEHKKTILQWFFSVGALASIVGLALASSGLSPKTWFGGSVGQPSPDQPSVEVFIESMTLPVDITIDERPCGRLHPDQSSTTVRLPEGRHHLVATKGDLHWEEWFIVGEANQIRLIPPEDAFEKR